MHRHLIALGVVAGLLTACRPPTVEEPPIQARRIAAVSEYRKMSDTDLKVRYQERLGEIHVLYGEMKGAMEGGDPAAVNETAREALARAYDARLILKHIEDPEMRESSDQQLGGFIESLEDIVTSTARPSDPAASPTQLD